jgi:hypothetical protein
VLGVLDRAKVANDVKSLEQDARASLRKHGVRFGAYHLYLPLLLKPTPRALASLLWALKHGGLEQKGRDEIAHLALSGRTSIPADKDVHRDLSRAAGFHVAGERALRVVDAVDEALHRRRGVVGRLRGAGAMGRQQRGEAEGLGGLGAEQAVAGYRLEDAAELQGIGWDDYLDEEGVILVEWSEKFPAMLPPATYVLAFRILPDGVRHITLSRR